VEIKLHSCLTWALCGDGWLTSHAGRLTAGKILPGIPRAGGRVGLRNGLDVLEEKNKFWPLPVFEVRIVQLLA